jgi:hypothetical protein
MERKNKVLSIAVVVFCMLMMGGITIATQQTEKTEYLPYSSEISLEDFNNKNVDGSQVKEVISLHETEPFAVLVKTTALQELVSKDSGCEGKSVYVNYDVLLEGTETLPLPIPSSRDKYETIEGEYVKTTVFSDTTDFLLKVLDNDSIKLNVLTESGLVVESCITGELEYINGIIQVNYDTSPTVEEGNINQIHDEAVFNSMLVVDNLGEVIGLMFTEI